MKHGNRLVLCLVLAGIVVLAYLFIPQVQSLGVFGLIIFACPLIHLFLGHGDHDQTTKKNSSHH